MAALRGADGAFLLGEMAPHTMNAGKTYFPAGTPDPADIFDGKVDLDASARRELLEETGIAADEAAIRRDWTVVFAPGRIACMKLMTLAVPADQAKARIEAFLATRPVARVHPHAHRAQRRGYRRGADARVRGGLPARGLRLVAPA